MDCLINFFVTAVVMSLFSPPPEGVQNNQNATIRTNFSIYGGGQKRKVTVSKFATFLMEVSKDDMPSAKEIVCKLLSEVNFISLR